LTNNLNNNRYFITGSDQMAQTTWNSITGVSSY